MGLKKLILSFFIVFLIFLHINIIRNCNQSMSIINYINSCMDGQVSTEFNIGKSHDWTNSISDKIKNLYSYRPPKVVFYGYIMWSVLGFIVSKSFVIDNDVFGFES